MKDRKEYQKKYQAAYYQRNKEKIIAYGKAWRKANPEKEKSRNNAYHDANPGFKNALNAKRNAKKVTATPPWANLERIKEIYVEAAYWNGIWPEDPVHVDHIIPLQGKTISGLHVESNLQILRASENIKKSNSFSL